MSFETVDVIDMLYNTPMPALGTGRLLCPTHHTKIHGPYLAYGCVNVAVMGAKAVNLWSNARAIMGDGDLSVTGGNYPTYVTCCNADSNATSPNNETHGSIKG